MNLLLIFLLQADLLVKILDLAKLPPLNLYNKSMCTTSLRQQQKEESRMKHGQESETFGYCTSLSNLLEKHEKLMGGHFTRTQKQPRVHTQQGIFLIDVNQKQESLIQEEPLESYSQKARLVRQIQVKISLLESKSKQPGIKDHDLQPIGQEIYNKFDQYFIRFGNFRPRYTVKQKGSAAVNIKLNHSTNKNSEVNPTKTSKSHRKQHSLLSSSSISRIKPSSSKIVRQNQQEVINRKMYNTAANLSVDSLNDYDHDIEERPFFQTKMDESQLEGLNHNYDSRHVSEQEGDNFNESYIQLKENIRVMQQRIAFLIHRLQQNKKEVSSLKDINKCLQQRIDQQVKCKKDLRGSLQQKNIEIITIQQQNQNLQTKMKKILNQKHKIEHLLDKNEKQIDGLKEELEFARTNICEKESKIQYLDSAVKVKAQEHLELTQAFKQLEKDQEDRKEELLRDIQEYQMEKATLKDTIRQYKIRFQAQGLSFNYEEANKLKKLIEQSGLKHQKQIAELQNKFKTEIDSLKKNNSQIIRENEALSRAVSKWMKLDPSSMFNPEVHADSSLTQQFKKMVENHNHILSLNKSYEEKLSKSQDRLEILKQQCQQRFVQLKTLQSQNKEMKDLIQKQANQKDELVKYLSEHICQNSQKIREEEERNSKMRASKIESRIIQIKLYKKIAEETVEMTLEYFLKKKMITTVGSILKFAIKIIDFALDLQLNSKKKLPSLAPHSILLSIKNFSDLQLSFSIITKKEEEEGLMYQAPEIVLGFNESSSSHCWTIGIIIDELLHGKRFFKAFTDILSHKDNYVISDEKYKDLTVLSQMIKKNHKLRIGLEFAHKALEDYLRLNK